jgi:hypothetical protein
VLDCLAHDLGVRSRQQSDIGYVLSDVATLGQCAGKRRRQLSVDEEPHPLPSAENHVASLRGRVLEACSDVVALEVGVISEDLRFGCARGEKREHIGNADACASYRGATVHYLRINRDALQQRHHMSLIPAQPRSSRSTHQW